MRLVFECLKRRRTAGGKGRVGGRAGEGLNVKLEKGETDRVEKEEFGCWSVEDETARVTGTVNDS